VERTVAEFGGIDVLVNNSGGPPRAAALELGPEDYARAVELLLLSVVRLTGLCLPHLERSGRGRVITITSSSVKEPVDNLALSNSVRPGVVGWSKTLSRELGARGITVNAIAPGRIERAERAGPGGNPAPPPGRPARGSRCRLLPRIRPRRLRLGYGHSGRRRVDSQPALADACCVNSLQEASDRRELLSAAAA
jgi:NAD(P)-dependent dehydrogenase (short-subunit alcohol dehydrogenase family)